MDRMRPATGFPYRICDPAENAPLPTGPDVVPPAIQRVIVCINGYLQDRHGRTGLGRVWRHLHARHAGPQTWVTNENWNCDWRGFVSQLIDVGRPTDIRIIAYSWGVGHGALKLCQALRSEGLEVARLVSCDGVYRSGWALWRSLWSPVLGEPVIRFPSNVRRIDYVMQRENLPRGHRILGESKDTEVVFHGILDGHTHQSIDNSHELLQLALNAAAG